MRGAPHSRFSSDRRPMSSRHCESMRWTARTSQTAPPAAREAIAVPPIDGGRLNQHQHVAPRRPHPSQNQPEQTVRRSKASIPTRPDGHLMAQGQYFEQEVSTSRQGESDRSEGPNDVLHRALQQPPTMPLPIDLAGHDI